MSNLFSFEQTPWELTVEALHRGGSFSAVRFLTLLEGEEEEAVEAAFEDLEQLETALDIADLPADFGSGETAARLHLEQKLVKEGNLLQNLGENDPLRLYLEEMAAIPVCGDIRILAAEAEKNQSMLVNLSLSRVVELAGQYTGRGLLLMDLIQEGSVGLWQGILHYTGDGMDFEQFRDWWIRQYMARAVVLQARQSGVGQKMRKALEDYRSADRKLLTQLGRNPTVEEIALDMGVGGEEAQVYEQMLRSVQLLASANAPKKETEQEGTIVFDLMPEKFTLNRLQETYELILGRKLITPNFRRKIMPMVIQTQEQVMEAGHRPAKLFMRNLEAFYA